MKNYCDMCFKCNDTMVCITCEQREDCIEFEKCFGIFRLRCGERCQVLTIF